MTFSTGVYEHPQFKLLQLLSELYKGSSLTLSIDFLILTILYSPRPSQGCSLKQAYKFTSHNIILPQINTGKDNMYRERQYVSFLLNIELVSLCFYVSLLHRERPSRSLGFNIREAQEKLTVFHSKAKASTDTYHPL
jgi:hypothetical protein